MVAVSLLLGDKLYYTEFSENQQIVIGAEESCFLVVPELERKLSIQLCGDVAQVTVNCIQETSKENIITAPVDECTVIDYERRIMILFTKASKSHERVYLLDNNCTIEVGRSKKKLLGGAENGIIVDLPFIAREQMQFVFKNGKMFVRDKNSTNGTFVNGQKITKAELKSGDVISVLTFRIIYDGSSLSFQNAGNSLTIRKSYCQNDDLKTEQEGQASPANSPIIHERSARLKDSIEKITVTIPAPPVMGEKPKVEFTSTFLPAIITIAIGIVTFFISGSITSILYLLPMSLSGVIVSVINFRKQNRKYGEEKEKNVASFISRLDESERTLKEFNSNQLAAMEKDTPRPELCTITARDRSSGLWSRKPTDSDFLAIRLGAGEVPTQADIKPEPYNGNSNEKLAQEYNRVKSEYSFIKNAPVCSDFQKNHITGIVGDPADTSKLLNNIIIQLLTNNCYTDLRIVYLNNRDDMVWAADVPHITGYSASSLEEADSVLAEVINTLSEREKVINSHSYYGDPVFFPYILLVVTDPELLPKNTVTDKFLSANEKLGCGVVMMVQDQSQLPQNSSVTITVTGNAGETFSNNRVSDKRKFTIDDAPANTGELIARYLRNVRVRENIEDGIVGNNEEVFKGSGLPTDYTFYEMIGVKSADEIDLIKRWGESKPDCELSAPVGIGSNGIVNLNIFGSAADDGPHGLICGTTGSGKTGFIVSYLLALATLYSPNDLNFAIIDFKGGAMGNAFKNLSLPHLVGCISNLDGKDIERAIKAITGEVIYRQNLLNETNKRLGNNIANISQYISLYKAGKVSEPMPHLVIVADEFAELKEQHPEYLKDLVQVARTGNSLGLHLILATQSPTGNVTSQINANIKFRVCLKAADQNESMTVINAPDASTIKDAGRAYLLDGNKDLKMIQSGFAGFPNKAGGMDANSQFKAVVAHILDYCAKYKIRKMPDIFMSPLPGKIPFPSKDVSGDIDGTVDLGTYDDPLHKAQKPYKVSLLHSNLIITGSAKMGKTNLLQTVIRSLAEQYSPVEVNIYIMDFASMMLKPLEGLNHVGGVVTQAEDEKLNQLMRILNRELMTRKAKLLKAKVNSLEEYRRYGNKDIPHIVVIIDNLTALRQLYGNSVDNDLIRLCSDGLSVGISVIVSNTDTKGGIGYNYLSYFDSRIALYSIDSNNYSELFPEPCDTVKKIPGRCLANRNDDVLDAQLYLAFDKEPGQTVDAFCERTSIRWGEQKAPRIPEIPATLSVSDLLCRTRDIRNSPYAVSMGLDYETVEPEVCDLTDIGCLSLSGGKPAAQSEFLEALIWQLNALYPQKAKVWIVDSNKRPLQSVSTLPNVIKYSYNPTDFVNIIAELEKMAEARMSMLQLDAGSMEEAEPLVLVVNNPNADTIMNQTPTALTAFSNLISIYKDAGICVLVSDVPNASYIPSQFYNKCAANKQFLWFDNLSNLQLVTLPYTVTKQFAKPVGAGDVFFIDKNNCKKLKYPKIFKTLKECGDHNESCANILPVGNYPQFEISTQ